MDGPTVLLLSAKSPIKICSSNQVAKWPRNATSNEISVILYHLRTVLLLVRHVWRFNAVLALSVVLAAIKGDKFRSTSLNLPSASRNLPKMSPGPHLNSLFVADVCSG